MFDPHAIASDLRRAVDEGVELILAAPEERSAQRENGDGWCAREVIGHLIDSACNNHRRFIINQSPDVDTLIVDPYTQNEWVECQRYAETPAARLAALWAVYNRHLADVIDVIPGDVFNRARGSLADYSFSYIDEKQGAATIGHLAADYVAHIRHHIIQIRRLLAR
jgi:hypothetical protein